MLKYLNIFILVIGVRVIEAVDCDDGNKGGCSHVCFQSKSFDGTNTSVYIIFKDVCRCPKCWELDESGLNCLPETGKVKINCSPSGMAVLVDKCVIPGERTLGLNDFNVNILLLQVDDNEYVQCVPKQDPNGDYLFSTTLEKCGTLLKIDENGENATFRNTIIAKPYRRKGVAFGRDLKFDVQCTYGMTYLDAQGGQEIENGIYETKTFSTGSLNFDLDFYTGSSYDAKVDADNNPRRVGNTIFFDVHALVPLDKLSFYVTDCTVTEGMNYIIQLVNLLVYR